MKELHNKLKLAIKALETLNIYANDALTEMTTDESLGLDQVDPHVLAVIEWLADTSRKYDDYLFGQEKILKAVMEKQSK